MADDEAREALAAAAAAMDQLNAFGKDVALGTVTYFKTLLDGGLERGEALLLTNNYQATILDVLFHQRPPAEQ